MSIILGLDPGTSSVGFGILKKEKGQMEILDWGIISTEPNIPLSEKLFQIGNDLDELLDRYHPTIAGMEELFFTNNIKTGIAVSHSR